MIDHVRIHSSKTSNKVHIERPRDHLGPLNAPYNNKVATFFGLKFTILLFVSKPG